MYVKISALFFVACFACVPQQPAAPTAPRPIVQPTSFPANATQDEIVDSIKNNLTTEEGCSAAMSELEELKKRYGTSADYYFYKADCFRDTNPDKACTNYLSFLKVAKADARVAQAKSYLQSQDPAAYPTCTLP